MPAFQPADARLRYQFTFEGSWPTSVAFLGSGRRALGAAGAAAARAPRRAGSGGFPEQRGHRRHGRGTGPASRRAGRLTGGVAASRPFLCGSRRSRQGHVGSREGPRRFAGKCGGASAAGPARVRRRPGWARTPRRGRGRSPRSLHVTLAMNCSPALLRVVGDAGSPLPALGADDPSRLPQDRRGGGAAALAATQPGWGRRCDRCHTGRSCS